MHAEVEATVQTGAAVTTYRRAGRGGRVLMLAAADSAAASLFDRLAGQCCVVKPELPAECSKSWLSDLIEALGLDRPVVVTEARLEPGLKGAGGDRLGRIFVVPEGLEDASAFIDVIAAEARHSRP
jgi:hypothetical protein